MGKDNSVGMVILFEPHALDWANEKRVGSGSTDACQDAMPVVDVPELLEKTGKIENGKAE